MEGDQGAFPQFELQRREGGQCCLISFFFSFFFTISMQVKSLHKAKEKAMERLRKQGITTSAEGTYQGSAVPSSGREEVKSIETLKKVLPVQRGLNVLRIRVLAQLAQKDAAMKKAMT